MIRFLSLFSALALVLTFTACGQRTSRQAALFENNYEQNDSERDQETLRRSLSVFATMEDYPDLPGLVGEETLNSLVDRFNKWIEPKRVDEFWQSFLDVEESAALARKQANLACRALELLQSLQAESNAAEVSARTLATELIIFLRELDSKSRTFSETAFPESTPHNPRKTLPYFADIAQIIAPWEQLLALNNLNDGAVRAFARQQTAQREALESLTRTLATFADSLDIATLRFTPLDMQAIKQATWMRLTSQWARGEAHREIDRAQALFDFVVRNIDIVASDADANFPTQQPWQTLLLGRGTITDRAWVFIELLRQQRIEACLLYPCQNDNELGNNELGKLWGIGVLVEEELYLFLAEDGVPVPGNAGIKWDKENGGLVIPQVATLNEWKTSEEIRNRVMINRGVINRDSESKEVASEIPLDFAALILVASAQVSAKMKILERASDIATVLYSAPHEAMARFSKIPHLHKITFGKRPLIAQLETFMPYSPTTEAMQPFTIPSIKNGSRSLWRGRVLYLNGKLSGQDSAASVLQNAITPDRLLYDMRNDTRNAPANNSRGGMEQVFTLANSMATFWLGHAAFVQGNWESAQHFFETRERAAPINFGRLGRLYLLGRLAERAEKIPEAIEFYQHSGHPLRAQWLESLM